MASIFDPLGYWPPNFPQDQRQAVGIRDEEEKFRQLMEMQMAHARPPPPKKVKPNLDTMRPLEYLRARNREWLEGVEI